MIRTETLHEAIRSTGSPAWAGACHPDTPADHASRRSELHRAEPPVAHTRSARLPPLPSPIRAVDRSIRSRGCPSAIIGPRDARRPVSWPQARAIAPARLAGTVAGACAPARADSRPPEAHRAGPGGVLARSAKLGVVYLISTTAPTSSSSLLSLSASSLGSPSLTGLGALSTSPLASFRPRLVAARTTLMTLIF